MAAPYRNCRAALHAMASHSLGMEATLTRKPVNTREKSSRKFMANDAWPAVLDATAWGGAQPAGRRGSENRGMMSSKRCCFTMRLPAPPAVRTCHAHAHGAHHAAESDQHQAVGSRVLGACTGGGTIPRVSAYTCSLPQVPCLPSCATMQPCLPSTGPGLPVRGR